ncbi:MAG: S1 RNA-binding domain-containing protein, partial [Rickettsiales bacterium]|nr:S1 RNA-binding domain-containing protein [Rickettsiales bacterium]
MTKRMLIDALHPEETRVVIADENQVYDFDFITTNKKQLKGNIYLAKITRVEPSLQAAFVEYGSGKQGFLPFSEIHTDYYQIPAADRKRLMEEAQAAIEEDDAQESAPGNDTPQEGEQSSSILDDESPAEPQETEANESGSTSLSESDRPAYLSQNAIDISVSEAPFAETDDMPMSSSLSQGEVMENDERSSENDAPKSEEGSPEASANEGVETLP